MTERKAKRGMKNSLRLKKDSRLLYGRIQNSPNLRGRFGGHSINKIEVSILASAVRLRHLQNPVHASVPVETTVIYLLAAKRYPLQVAVVYPIRATVGNKVELDVVAVRQP